MSRNANPRTPWAIYRERLRIHAMLRDERLTIVDREYLSGADHALAWASGIPDADQPHKARTMESA